MTKISGYPNAKVAILDYILEKDPKMIDRATVASLLEVSISTAGNYMQLIAHEFQNSLLYSRGTITVLSSIPTVDLPPQVKMQMRSKQIEEIKTLTSKIKSNHLAHSDLKNIEEALTNLKKKVSQL
jgi:hypothetical protein